LQKFKVETAAEGTSGSSNRKKRSLDDEEKVNGSSTSMETGIAVHHMS